RRPQNSGGSPVFSLLIFLLICGITIILLYANWDTLSNFGNEVVGNETTTESQLTESTPPPSEAENNPAAEQTEVNPEPPQPQPVTRRIQVEILNGCGVSGLAKRLTDYLRARGIDVVSSGNFRHFNMTNSEVLDRTGNDERSSKIAEILGIADGQVRVQKDSNLQLDATIILGADYRNLTPFRR
ncbi:MAG: LytR C-terminal domain-containing protein, partial [Calditrichota bacterium]